MAGVNLLPWREWRRRQAIRRWQGMLFGSLVVGALLSVAGVAVLDQRLERQAGANARLDERIAGLAEKLEQVTLLGERIAALQAQSDELQGLQQRQGTGGDLLFHLMHIVPAGARLSELHMADGELGLSGLARSGAEVAQLLRNLRQSPGLGAPDLQELGSSPAGERFRVSVSLQRPAP